MRNRCIDISVPEFLTVAERASALLRIKPSRWVTPGTLRRSGKSEATLGDRFRYIAAKDSRLPHD
jgi:hypothetical protein